MAAQASFFLDAEQPAFLRHLRQCSHTGDDKRWEALRGDLLALGYRVVVGAGYVP